MTLNENQAQLLALALGVLTVSFNRSSSKQTAGKKSRLAVDSNSSHVNTLSGIVNMSIGTDQVFYKSRLIVLYELMTSEDHTSQSHSALISTRSELLNGVLFVSEEQQNRFAKHIVYSTQDKVKTSTDFYFDNLLKNLTSFFALNAASDSTSISQSLVNKNCVVKALLGPVLHCILELSSEEEEEESDLTLSTDYMVYERVGSLCAMIRDVIRYIIQLFSNRLQALSASVPDGSNSCSHSHSYIQRVKCFQETSALRSAQNDIETWILQEIGSMIDRANRRFPLLGAALMRIVDDVETGRAE